MTTARGVQPHTDGRRAEEARAANYVFPNDTNHLGTMFGGRVLQLMDQTGAIAASRYARAIVVTAAMEAITFEYPIRQGMIIEAVARVVYTGRTSTVVRVEVFAENPEAGMGERVRATTGYLTFVALDAAGRPTPVPPLLVETEDEQAAHAAAEQMRHVAEERRAAGGNMAVATAAVGRGGGA